jgi:hypothetical protein
VLQNANYGYCVGYYALYISCQLSLPSPLGSNIFSLLQHYVAQFAAALGSSLYRKHVLELLEWIDVCMVASIFSELQF